ncbi:Topoisomerase 1-associated factor 1 [Allomyces arbusculus]|nr:Topoisomerase 1-associated factor 1 [Allomyces arbusculus]
MASQALESHLLSVCSAVGGVEELPTADGQGLVQRYVLGDEAIECLRDLKRFLRYDEASKEKTVARMLGKWQLLEKDLIPIMEQHSGNQSVFFAAVELVVPLTWPLESQYLGTDLLMYQRAYKDLLINSAALDRAHEMMLVLLETPFRQRSERTNAVIRLLLYLFRNLLAIPDPSLGAVAATDAWMQAQMQERLLFKLQKLDVLSFFVSVASSIADRQFDPWNTTMVEIFFLILCTCDVKTLFQTSNEAANETIADILAKESRSRIIPQKRHSRFAGTFVVKLGDGTKFNVHRHDNTIGVIDNSKQKNRPKLPFKKEAAAASASGTTTTGANERRQMQNRDTIKLLRDFAHEFLVSGFDALVQSVKRDMDAERTNVRTEDPIYLLYLIRFALEYQRRSAAAAQAPDTAATALPAVTPHHLSSVLNVHGLLFMIKNIRRGLDDAQMSQLKMGVDCLKHLLMSLQVLKQSPDADVRELAENVLDNLYYEKATLDLLIELIKGFQRQSREYLISLVETVHLLLKLLESFAKSSNLTVRQRRRGARRAQNEDDDPIARDVPAGIDADAGEAEPEPEFVERTITFDRIERQFCSDLVVEPYMRLLQAYRDLDEPVVHAVTKMLYRITVKCAQPALLFKLNYIVQMHTILHDKALPLLVPGTSPPKPSAFKDLVSLLRMVAHTFFECVERYPLLLVEVFFPHSRRDMDRIMSGRQDAPDLAALRKPTAKWREWDDGDEIEVRPGFSDKMQVMLVATALAAREGGADALARVLEQLTRIAQARKVPPRPGANEDDDEDNFGTMPTAWPEVDLALPAADLAIKELVLLLELLGLVLTFPDPAPSEDDAPPHSDAPPRVHAPSTLSGHDLDERIQWLLDAQAHPVSYNNRPAFRFLRKRKRPRYRHARAEGAKKRGEPGKREAKNAAAPKSAAYIYDSDAMLEDEDETEYYAKEQARRDKTLAMYEAAMGQQQQQQQQSAAKFKEAKPKRARRKPAAVHDSDDDDDEDDAAPSRQRQRRRRVADSDDDDDDAASDADDEFDGGDAAPFADDEDGEDEFSRRLSALRAKSSANSVGARRTMFFADNDDDDDDQDDDESVSLASLAAAGAGGPANPAGILGTWAASLDGIGTGASSSSSGGGIHDRFAKLRSLAPAALATKRSSEDVLSEAVSLVGSLAGNNDEDDADMADAEQPPPAKRTRTCEATLAASGLGNTLRPSQVDEFGAADGMDFDMDDG